MIRCPECSKSTVRDTRKCSCGHAFTGNEPDATPTPEDIREWERTSGQSLRATSPASIAPRVVALVISFILVVLTGPAVIQLRLGDMSGSLLPLFAAPVILILLWVLFSAFVVGALLIRDGSTISLFACVGIGFLLAIAAAALIAVRLPAFGPYGPGP